jgi:hypothetical protein
MHGFVGGYIELVRTLSGRVMFINEDGKRLELPVNRKVTEGSQGTGWRTSSSSVLVWRSE